MEEKKDIKEIKIEITTEVKNIDDDEDKLHWYSYYPIYFIAFFLFIIFGFGKLAIISLVMCIITGTVAMNKFDNKGSSMPWWYGGL